jgi:branched-chain amino acid transport system ATP-binding protein
MADTEKLLEVQNLNASYGAIKALTDVSLYVQRGEIVALIGANGAGKSTLLMTLFGNPRATSGRILLAGKDITHVPTHKISGLGIAQVPEGRRVFPRMTVLENLHMGTMNRTGTLEDSELAKIWKLFPRLLERQSQLAGTLSGGEQQMLAIGRALASKPQLLLLDEPSLGLAPLIVKQIMDNLREIAAGGTTIFLVEQNAHQALRLATRGYVLVNGKISLTGSGAELLANPEVQSAYLGGH